MIYIPFLYFTILTIFLYRKRGIDPSTYISLLYTITTGCSVLLAIDPSYVRYNSAALASVNFVPTILFCILITLSIAPVYIFNFRKINCITLKNTKFIKWITYAFFISFLLHVILYFKEFIFILALGDKMAELRTGLYHGDMLQLTKYPAPIEMIALPFKVLADFSYIMIFLYFFCICTIKLSKRMHLMMICGSLTSVYVGILGVDRSKTFYWVILAGLCFVLFYHYMDKKARKQIVRFGIVIVALIGTYFMAMTIARFGDSDGSIGSAILNYAGQSFINFCYFWENYNAPDGVTLKHLFPAISHFIFDSYDGAVPYQQEMSQLSGMECGVFYTYLGTFITSAGKLGPFIITIVYLILANLVMKRKSGTISFSKLTYIFLVLIIPTTGFILYMYTSTFKTLTLLFLVTMMHLLKDKSTLFLYKK